MPANNENKGRGCDQDLHQSGLVVKTHQAKWCMRRFSFRDDLTRNGRSLIRSSNTRQNTSLAMRCCNSEPTFRICGMPSMQGEECLVFQWFSESLNADSDLEFKGTSLAFLCTRERGVQVIMWICQLGRKTKRHLKGNSEFKGYWGRGRSSQFRFLFGGLSEGHVIFKNLPSCFSAFLGHSEQLVFLRASQTSETGQWFLVHLCLFVRVVLWTLVWVWGSSDLVQVYKFHLDVLRLQSEFSQTCLIIGHSICKIVNHICSSLVYHSCLSILSSMFMHL